MKLPLAPRWIVTVGLAAMASAVTAVSGPDALRAQSAADVPAPQYRVDPFWPKMPLPNKWLIQGVPVMVTDHQDHIWVVSRPRDLAPDESM